ncbi:antitoxin [Actinomadura alba]|uniref:Antitoxin n=1 Tax=Actinomadura alba TaxID=406431 RepID=A0ABR7LGY3_9ACTN|nr:antitoxin [Actinomadura alba]MBC6464036.1 antitoxin [Actinomadura alba]
MSIVDRVKKALGQHSDKVHRGVDELGGKLDEKTGGKYSDKIDKAERKIKNMTDDRGDQPGGRSA